MFILATCAPIAQSENDANKTKIYVVDSGIWFGGKLSPFKCNTGHKSFVPFTSHPHGTQMSRVIIKNNRSRDICLVDISIWRHGIPGEASANNMVKALNYIETQPVGFINISMNGPALIEREKKQLIKLADMGFKISLTAGNDGINLDTMCAAFPACYFKLGHPNIKVSSNFSSTSNKNGPVTDVDTMTGGTSFSTANTTSKWVSHLHKLKEQR